MSEWTQCSQRCPHLCPHALLLNIWHRLWRRKHIVLALILIASFLLIFSLNFHSIYDNNSNNNNNNNNNNNLMNKNKLKNINKVPEAEYGIFDRNLKPIQQKLTQNEKQLETKSQQIKYKPNKRLVHLDLKGAPPKVSYFKQIFPLLRAAGADGIMLEYEDMFPFWGQLSAAKAGNSYTLEEIKTIQELAKNNNLEIIPLIQTFGHLEFFLKLKEFRHLREVDEYPQAICPSNNDSFVLIKEMVDQMLSKHPDINYLHIGCDEVYHIGFCTRCRFQERDTLFLSHVSRVARYVRETHPKVIPIIWDDMLRQIPTEKIKESGIAELGVEPMIWTYIKDIYRFIPYSQWITLSEIFPHVWSASAFKGAFGETLTVPNIRMHLENNEAWIQVMAEQNNNFKSIRGIAITGWQRYDHLATLCELLPSSFPSLIIQLLVTNEGFFDSKLIFKKFDQIMKCNTNSQQIMDTTVDLDNDPYLFSRTINCDFPGVHVYRAMQQHSDVIKRVNDYLYDVTIHKAWLTDYNIRHNISSPYRVDEALQEYSSVYYSIQSLLRTVRDALKEVFDDFTVNEWIEQNIYPYILKMEQLMQKSSMLKKAKVWPKRPLPVLEDLKRLINN